MPYLTPRSPSSRVLSSADISPAEVTVAVLLSALLFQFSTSSAVIAGSASSFALSAAVKSSAD